MAKGKAAQSAVRQLFMPPQSPSFK